MLNFRILFRYIASVAFAFLFGLLAGNSCFAINDRYSLPEQQLLEFAQNDIMFYNPFECVRQDKTNISANHCFKVDDNVSAQDFWYAEGCLDNGTCSAGLYAGGKNGDSLIMTNNNPFLYNDTKTDDDFGGMQYIYAENYDFEYDGASTKLKKNGKNSTRKYYWIVLPDQAYTNGLGDTYVATFGNLDEPIYFIVFDAHACGHQSEKYCDQAKSDPNKVAIGKEFFGAFTKNGGAADQVAKKLGKLTSFCRLKGSGEVTAKGDSGTITTASGGGGSSGSGNVINDMALELAWPYGQADKAFGGPTTAYANAIKETTLADMEANGGTWNEASRRAGKSCDLFVATVMRSSGADKDYPIGLPGQYPYVAGSEKYESVSYEDARGGDIAFYSDNTGAFNETVIGGGNGHTWLIVEDKDGKRLRAQASYPDEAGAVKDLAFEEKDIRVFRLKGGGGSSCTSYEGDYPQYYQDNYEASDHENSDHNWSGDSYNGGDVGDSGCGPTSAAMLFTVATGEDIYPQDVIKITSPSDPLHYNYVGSDLCKYDGDCGIMLDNKMGEKYGVEVELVSYSSKTDAYDKMKKYLNDGYMLHFSGHGSYPGFSNSNTNGHYVGIFSIDKDDNVWVANSNDVGNSQVKLQNMVDAIHNGVFTAIKGSNAKTVCGSSDSSCPGDISNGGKVSASGITADEAGKIAHYYNTQFTPVGCCGLTNCVEFSNFFVSQLTKGGYAVSGDGGVLASNIISSGQAKGGSEPRAWAVFSDNVSHTGVVVGANEDGTYITIEAAWPGWRDGYMDGSGNARVDSAKTFTDHTYTFAYFEDDLDTDKINEILNK